MADKIIIIEFDMYNMPGIEYFINMTEEQILKILRKRCDTVFIRKTIHFDALITQINDKHYANTDAH